AEGDLRLIETDNDNVVLGRTVMIATGVSYRRIEAEGVSRLMGTGVSYTPPSVSTPRMYEGKNVFVVGGANSAGQAAMFLCKQPGCRVTMVIRSGDLSVGMSKYLIDRLEESPNVTVMKNTQVVEACGDKYLENVLLRHGDGQEMRYDCNHLFVLIGGVPKTRWLNGSVARNEKGFVLTGNNIPQGWWKQNRPPLPMETSMPGVFAAGDVRLGSIKRIVAAVGEGGHALQNVHEYLALTPRK
ncbi:MAG: NAD(P)/FAD-dependent oxidoreductase, partial [Candidatus Pacebacteria bacterium]|nr:NAD(P)/FAD-dependent oxidoreductase [Candidatus Paceibacterota bacterium]